MDKARPISIDVGDFLLHQKPIYLEEKDGGDKILVKIIKGFICIFEL